MAQHQSALKRARQNRKRRLRNRMYKSRMKTEIRKLRNLDEKEAAELQYRKVTSLLDKLAAKGIIHPNNAANKKSKLASYVARLS